MSKIPAKKFIEYHLSNPQVWLEFERLTLSLLGAGISHYGAKAVMEVIRFHKAIETQGEFKINNNFTAHYARQFAKKYPQHENFYEFRGS